MEFATDKYCVSFGGITLFVSEYAFARNAASGETALLNGSVALRNGGGKALRITLSGKSESPCACLLDTLLTSGEPITVEYGGVTFENALLLSYSCKGKSGSSEAVTVEFACEGQAAETAVTE